MDWSTTLAPSVGYIADGRYDKELIVVAEQSTTFSNLTVFKRLFFCYLFVGFEFSVTWRSGAAATLRSTRGQSSTGEQPSQPFVFVLSCPAPVKLSHPTPASSFSFLPAYFPPPFWLPQFHLDSQSTFSLHEGQWGVPGALHVAPEPHLSSHRNYSNCCDVSTITGDKFRRTPLCWLALVFELTRRGKCFDVSRRTRPFVSFSVCLRSLFRCPWIGDSESPVRGSAQLHPSSRHCVWLWWRWLAAHPSAATRRLSWTHIWTDQGDFQILL